MERQLEGLKEMLSGGLTREQEDEQMKELYDCLESEDRAKEAEFVSMEEQLEKITELLDRLEIPQAGSVSDRVEMALVRSTF